MKTVQHTRCVAGKLTEIHYRLLRIMQQPIKHDKTVSCGHRRANFCHANSPRKPNLTHVINITLSHHCQADFNSTRHKCSCGLLTARIELKEAMEKVKKQLERKMI